RAEEDSTRRQSACIDCEIARGIAEKVTLKGLDMRVKPERRAENFEKQDLFLTHKMTQEGQAQMKAWSGSGRQVTHKYGKFTCSG
ncbi:MAG: hypothetical protein ABI134_06395, partial [Byssovorax sp.]